MTYSWLSFAPSPSPLFYAPRPVEISLVPFVPSLPSVADNDAVAGRAELDDARRCFRRRSHDPRPVSSGLPDAGEVGLLSLILSLIAASPSKLDFFVGITPARA